MIYVLRYTLIGLYTVFWGSAAPLMAVADRDGENVIVIPEGTRNQTATLGRFKSGGFHLAIRSEAPIIPVSVSGSWRITPKKTQRVESGGILIRYGKPIPTRDLTIEDRAYLKQQVREAIVAGFDPELQGPASRG